LFSTAGVSLEIGEIRDRIAKIACLPHSEEHGQAAVQYAHADRMKSYILDLVEELAAGTWKPKLQGAASNQPGKYVVMSTKNNL